MAVLVMELIDAEAAGVMFTRDPRDGTNHILINVALGLGELRQILSFLIQVHWKSRNET